MKTRHPAWRRSLFAASVLVASSAVAAVQEIPITTSNADAKLAFDAGQAALDRGDGAQANALFRVAVAADPDFTYAWVNLSNVTFSTEEFSAALKGGEQGAAKASGGERRLLEFNQQFLANNPAGQLEIAKKLTAEYPNSVRAWLLQAGAHAALNQFAEQRAALLKAIQLDPKFAPSHFTLAGSYLFNDPKDFAQAEMHYRHAIQFAPGIDMYYWSLGDVYRGTNRLEDARRFYQLALKLDPSDLISPIKLGHVDSFLGNYEDARKEYDQGIAAGGPANAAFLLPFKALTYLYAGDASTAVKALEGYVDEIDTLGAGRDQTNNAKVFSLTQAAQIAMFNGMNDDARRVLARRSALMRDNAKAVGSASFANVQETQIAFFDGQLAAWRGDWKGAAAAAKKVTELSAADNNPRKMEPVHEINGLVELRKKNYRKAVDEFRKADLTQLHNKYQLAQALEGAGQKDEAVKIYREVSVNNFNTVDFAMLRRDALKKAG
jgi:tetratricopeptide (TPR) repeat protein